MMGGGGGGGPMGGSGGGGPMGGMGFGGRVKRFFFINTFSKCCPFIKKGTGSPGGIQIFLTTIFRNFSDLLFCKRISSS